MRILTVDPGSQIMGYAILTDKKITDAGFFKFRGKWCYPKACEIIESLSDIIESESSLFDALVTERFYRSGGRGANVISEVRGIIMAVAAFFDIPFIDMHAKTVKKILGLSGNAGKEDIKKLVIKSTGKLIGKSLPYDVYDAIAIGLAYIRSL